MQKNIWQISILDLKKKKTFIKVGTEGTFLNLIKDTDKKLNL